MENTSIQDFIEKVQESDLSAATKEALIQALHDQEAELSPDASQEEITEAIARAMARAAGSMALTGVSNGNASYPTGPDHDYIAGISDQVEAFFRKKDWKYDAHDYDSDGDRRFTLSFNVEFCNLRVRVLLEQELRVIRIEAILPVKCESLYDYLVCKAIVKDNYPKRFGALHYDERDGEVSYRYSYLVRHAFHEDEFERYFHAVVGSADDAYPLVNKLCVGKLKRKELNDVLEHINALVEDLTGDE